ncbi:uncharacterized protein [Haliotis cracherodii]|uniref:uncharacterized protein isoform X2 n=1 Tax=Haliotis cracherodii TaxID=6455 RepID=UPI0039E9D645
MADGHAEELLDIASIEHQQRINPFDIETPTETAKGSNLTRPCLKRAGSDPSAAKRTVIGHSQSDRPDYVTTTGPRPRDVSTHSGGERVRARTRTRHTHAIHPLYVSRATGESRYGSGGLRTVDMSQGPDSISSLTSSPDRFLASQGSPYLSQLMSVVQSMDDGLHHKNIKMSRRLPSWMWYLLARSLGIKLNPLDKPIFATLLHVITLTAAVTFGITGAWYNVCDILSEYSKTTVLIGTVTMMIGFGWILLGVYAHKLAGKLFSNKNFAESVRMHSKTFLKISTAGLMSILGLGLVGINSYDGFDLFFSSSCTKIQLQPIVCHIQFVSKTFYALLCVLWTLLVGFVMLSVCRTHTIGVRRFMREMTMDAKVYEAFWMEQVLGQVPLKQREGEQQVEEEWFIWDDLAMNSDFDNDVVTSQGVFLESICGPTFSPVRSRGSRCRARSEPITDHSNTSRENDVRSAEEADREKEEMEEKKETNDESCDVLAVPPIMSNDSLLFSYWKMSRRLAVTSRFLQRWLSSWIAFIFIWCADYIIFWANHSATLTGILQFVFPLLVLLLICSAYAEVNAEGQRLIKCICPTESRLRLLQFFIQQPLQMQVFSFPITYNAILGVILAFSVAFASRIVLDEVL